MKDFHISKQNKQIKIKYTSKDDKTKDFIQKSIQRHGNWLNYEKTFYKNSNTKLTITCPIHGDFYPTPNNHLYNKATSCPNGNCQKLSNEERIAFQKGYIICRSCTKPKLANEKNFPLRENKETFRRNCRECLASNEKSRRIKLGENYRISERARHKHNKTKRNLCSRKNYIRRMKDNLWVENERKRNRIRAKNYSHKWAKQTAKRRAQKLNATPPWLNKNDFDKISAVYEEARIKSKISGIKHHVDHVVPLLGKKVCGLHVPWNLQIISANANLKKSNKFPI